MTARVLSETTLRHALDDLRYELVPASSVLADAGQLHPGACVTITTSAKLGLQRTVNAAVELSGIGFRAVPHIAARQIEDFDRLSEIVDQLTSAGVDDIIALAGDASPPAGAYSCALDLLESLERLGRPFSNIGITGYPEGHPFITDERLQQALIAKAGYASYIVTQMCFSPERIRDWIAGSRVKGVDLPVYVGIPGMVSQKQLLAMAFKIGVGDSLRYLRRNPANVMRMMLSAEYDPEHLVRELAPLLSSEYGVAGFHVYTFNALAATELWRRNLAARLAELAGD